MDRYPKLQYHLTLRMLCYRHLYFNIHFNLCFVEDVESMTGEIENGDLAIQDVADLLQSQYAIIAGEKN